MARTNDVEQESLALDGLDTFLEVATLMLDERILDAGADLLAERGSPPRPRGFPARLGRELAGAPGRAENA